MKVRSKLSRAASGLLATAVAILTLSVLAHATLTFNTARAALVNYSLAAGATSAPITPAADLPVLVMGNQITTGDRGIGFVHMLHAAGNFLEWVGEDASITSSGRKVVSGFSASAGTHVIFLDFGGSVDIQVASADTFIIKNAAAGPSPATGEVTLIW